MPVAESRALPGVAYCSAYKDVQDGERDAWTKWSENIACDDRQTEEDPQDHGVVGQPDA